MTAPDAAEARAREIVVVNDGVVGLCEGDGIGDAWLEEGSAQHIADLIRAVLAREIRAAEARGMERAWAIAANVALERSYSKAEGAFNHERGARYAADAIRAAIAKVRT